MIDTDSNLVVVSGDCARIIANVSRVAYRLGLFVVQARLRQNHKRCVGWNSHLAPCERCANCRAIPKQIVIAEEICDSVFRKISKTIVLRHFVVHHIADWLVFVRAAAVIPTVSREEAVVWKIFAKFKRNLIRKFEHIKLRHTRLPVLAPI